MTIKAHTIQHQYLHVEVNGAESDAWVLQNRLSGWCHYDLLPALEKVFNRFAKSENWSIDRLDIDAGVITQERLEQDLALVVAEAIEKKLYELAAIRPSSTVAAINIRHKTNQQCLAEALVYFLSTGRLPWSVQLAKNKNFEQTLLDAWQDTALNISSDLILGALHYATARKRLVRQFSPLFMTTLLTQFSPEGKKVIEAILPTLQNSDTPSVAIKQFEQHLWETLFAFIAAGKTVTENAIVAEAWRTLSLSNTQQALENELLDAWQKTTAIKTHPAIMLSVLTSETARKRLVRQFSQSLMTNLLAQLSPEGKKVIEAILVILQNSDTSPFELKHFEQQLWESLFTIIATGKTVTENAIIADAWQVFQGVKTPALENLLVRYWPTAIASTRSPSLTKLKPLVSVPVIQPSDSKNDLTTDHEQENLKITDSVKQFKYIDINKPFDSQKDLPVVKPALESADIKEGIYIDNAGLILLHPFLPQFFEALDIAAEDKLLKPGRALCLLHFLTTGQTIAPEYELILPKILCNIPLETPVESDVELTDPEKEEAAALLEAVIRHWDALRNTGIDGLRGTFLLRFGKLSLRSDGDWLLQVESNTVDILLNHLPWGIAMIKLPWMQRMLWVEWTN